MGSDSIPSKKQNKTKKKLSDVSTNRGLVCAYMHSNTRTQKILTFMSLTGEFWQKQQTQQAPSMKIKYDYLKG